MNLTASLAVIITALAFATMAGLYFTFSTFVMRALHSLPAPQAIAAMNAINKVILASWAMPLFFGSSLLAAASIWFGAVYFTAPAAQAAVIVAGSIYLLGMLGVTALFNVPLNNRLAAADLQAPGPEDQARHLWDDYYRRWLRFNHIRTVSCLISGLLMLVILL